MATTSRSMSAFYPGAPPPGYPSPFYFPPFFPGAGWPGAFPPRGLYVGQNPMYQSQYPSYYPPQNSPGLFLRDTEEPPAPSTSTALVRITPTVRDTPDTYPLSGPEGPGVHPYLYQFDCPVEWDVRTNLRHNARRAGGERLSAIALKAPAINAGGANHNTMRIIFADPSFPWTISVTRESGITVGDVFMEIGSGLDVEVTDAEMVIAQEERCGRAEASRAANEGTGAVKTRPKGDAMRRVDWLLGKTRYRGLVHSSAKEYEELVQRKVHAHARATAWVLVMEDRGEDVAEGGDEQALVVRDA